ncbi:MAG: glycosyltransferase family 4 protein [Planctomycetaceae bacterium]|nr:glycosyltransferase family 4 protein [Planctomycetaceae bacterium]MBT4013225.1 glycosyltransferase family 4 protein [Planctomycetaceae bacterium]MBT4725648.1 glycosyltransferase family 4 protein [Planctomycetaceae bacterium]MBT4846387.1 glycosyltransferase family 4 protein [Planctomycetaceae bacterium]MBT5123729.1 glycosyltransferase family 4 protein [Planctomycetaceae bacterium]
MSEQSTYRAVVLITDLHRRITGVSATIRNLIPLQSEQQNVKLWARLPFAGWLQLNGLQVFKLLRRRPTDHRFHIWHARRNNEMLWALFFKVILRCPLKIVFTSAAIRRHSMWPRWLISKMDAVIATSPAAANLVEPVAAVVGHGVDVQRFAPKGSRTAALAKMEVVFEKAIGQFGRVRPEKGSDIFVEAMIELLPDHPEFGAVLVGKVTSQFEKFSEQLQEKVHAAGLQDRIVWYGEVPFSVVPAVYNAMSLVVAPSRYEGFGLTPIEAMASGAPVVASDTGAYRQMIDQGVTGAIFPVGNDKLFRGHLRELMGNADRLSEMGAICQAKVQREFSVEKEAAGINEVYEAVWST